jgi:hypothetical protein
MNDRADEFERLVDGELSADEYRELLAALEEEPEGWRRCAMAFLEAQALAHDLGGVAKLTPSCAPPRIAPAKSKFQKLDNIVMLLAIAASFLVAFGLGIAAPSIVRLAMQENRSGGNINGQPSSVAAGNANERPTGATPRYIGDVQLLVDGGARTSPEASRVPVYDVGRDVSSYLSHEVPALTPEMIDLVRQLGFDVRHEQHYLPAPLDDGRQIIVPVDGYQITPVSRRY